MYDRMALPPFDAGGVKLTLACSPVNVAVTLVGVPGMMAFITVSGEIVMSAARLLIVHVVAVVASQPVPQESMIVSGGRLAVSTTFVVLIIEPEVHVPLEDAPFQMQFMSPALLVTVNVCPLGTDPPGLTVTLRFGSPSVNDPQTTTDPSLFNAMV